MTIRDILHLGKVLALTVISWCVLPRHWRKAAALTGRFAKLDQGGPLYDAILGQRYSKSEIAALIRQRHEYSRESKLQILGLNGPWRSWRPDIRLIGKSSLEQSLLRNRGAILWLLETSFSALITKMALQNAGYYGLQLSRPGHGFAVTTPFGIRLLGPLWTKVEDRFIAERVVIFGETAAQPLKILRQRLGSNGIVLITLAPLAHRFAEVPFFHGHIQIPIGPIRLALETDAALLPVFTVAKKDVFEVLIDKPIYPGGVTANVNELAAAYAKRMEPFVLDYPDQWMGWDWLPGRFRAG